MHSRFSTNTFPSWSRAQPFRALCHNGEINTLRGNKNLMRSREAGLSSPYFGEQLSELTPITSDELSDSGNLDAVVELLVHGGTRPIHSLILRLSATCTTGCTTFSPSRADRSTSAALSTSRKPSETRGTKTTELSTASSALPASVETDSKRTVYPRLLSESLSIHATSSRSSA